MTFFLFIIFINISNSENTNNFIRETIFKCGNNRRCEDYKEKMESIAAKCRDHKELKQRLKYFLLDDNIKGFNYKIYTNGGKNDFYVELDFKKVIKKINFTSKSTVSFSGIESFLPYKSGGYYNHRLKKIAFHSIKKYMSNRGFGNSEIKFQKIEKDDEVVLNFTVISGRPIKVKDILLLTENKRNKDFIYQRFQKYKGKNWNLLETKLAVKRLAEELFNDGYLNSKVELILPENDQVKKEVLIKIKLHLGEKFIFNFYGVKIFTEKELLTKIKSFIKDQTVKFDENKLKEMIVKFYKDIGIYGTLVEFRKHEEKSLKGDLLKTYFLDIKEGKKIEIKRISFSGNTRVSSKELMNLYYKHASGLASRNFFDEKYLNTFTEIIRRYFLGKGFVLVSIKGPFFTIDNQLNLVSVEYKIWERAPVKIRRFNISNVPSEIVKKIKTKLVNKKGQIFALTSLEDDLALALKIIQNEGYFFSRITNLDSKNIVKYNKSYTDVAINVNFDTGKKVIYNTTLITGNTKTREKVIRRELDFTKGDILTLEKLNKGQERLESLGIFSSVKIIPVVAYEKKYEKSVDLLVQLREEDTIIFEVAPGYRTDLGIKLSSRLIKKNFLKMNKTFLIKGQVNHRLDDFSHLDNRRRAEGKKGVEYISRLAYSDPYFMGLPMDFDFAISALKKRYFSFDARILKASALFSKSFGNFFLTSIKYQLEAITQDDATDFRDNGYFLIGSLTPLIAFDFRDSQVNARKGAYFSFSCEFANPDLGSQERESFLDEGDLEIDYYKLITRNKFYFPIGYAGTIALSLSLGYQRNLADGVVYDNMGVPVVDSSGNLLTQGVIPSIKVFRLRGVDTVRGFADSEINRLDSGVDISEMTISKNAYFFNIKFEPRYYINDNFISGLFFDAGNVYVNNFLPAKLQASVGVTLKYLTPVGSLNFDYGVKLKRRIFPDNAREGFGRFHLTIGVF